GVGRGTQGKEECPNGEEGGKGQSTPDFRMDILPRGKAPPVIAVAHHPDQKDKSQAEGQRCKQCRGDEATGSDYQQSQEHDEHTGRHPGWQIEAIRARSLLMSHPGGSLSCLLRLEKFDEMPDALPEIAAKVDDR